MLPTQKTSERTTESWEEKTIKPIISLFHFWLKVKVQTQEQCNKKHW